MENENTNEKKKQKVVILIGLVTLLIAVLGATYAYFQISTNNESSNTNITGKTPPKSLVTLKQGTSNLHLNISASDMSYDNRTKEYYGTDVDGKSYEDNEEDGTKTIAQVQLTEGEATTKYSCTAKLTVSKVTEPDADKDTIIEVLHSGDMILQFKGKIISEQLDLSELKTTGSKEYELNFKVTGNTPEEIQAYIKLLNKDEPQNYLAGKKLNLDISTSDLKCNVFIPNTKLIAQLKEDSQGTLSNDPVGGMYRYQGVDEQYKDDVEINPNKLPAVNNNYICFGIDKNCEKDAENNCTNIDNMSYDDYVDKYMYRIIGITEEGEMYLLKDTFLKNSITTRWNEFGTVSNCIGDACEWPNSDLFKRINGKISKYNTLFVNSPNYEYMKLGNPWYSKIENHNWMYGYVNYDSASSKVIDGETVYGVNNNGLILYDIETGVKPTSKYEKQKSSSFTVKVKNQWSAEKSVNAKIGLMYLHDYYLSYDNERNWSTWGTYDTSNWMYIYNFYSPSNNTAQHLISEGGILYDTFGDYQTGAFGVRNNGSIVNQSLYINFGGVRPTFYLNSDVSIKSGVGTKENPYILDVQEN